MKKTICSVEYDTEASDLIRKKVHGEFGDPAGYEESLYRTQNDRYFLYCAGGPDSPYPKETLKRFSKDSVKTWLDYGIIPE